MGIYSQDKISGFSYIGGTGKSGRDAPRDIGTLDLRSGCPVYCPSGPFMLMYFIRSPEDVTAQLLFCGTFVLKGTWIVAKFNV